MKAKLVQFRGEHCSIELINPVFIAHVYDSEDGLREARTVIVFGCGKHTYVCESVKEVWR